MSTHEQKISPLQSATFREYILLPRNTRPEHNLTKINLNTRLSDRLPLSIPFMSAAMESVTGVDLAVALALRGGLGILPAGRVEVDDQIDMVRQVKGYRSGFETRYIAVRPETTLAAVDELEEAYGFTTFPVLDSEDKLVGAVRCRDFDPRGDLSRTVASVMRPLSKLAVFSHRQAKTEVTGAVLDGGERRGYLVDDEGRMLSMIFRKGLKKELRLGEAVRDGRGRLRVGIAISTHPEDRERAKLCVQAGADVISVDASDGFSEYMRETVQYAKSLGVPIVAGNVVDRNGFEFLAQCGADAVKVGIGSGSICTTRRVKAIGRGQATAVLEVVKARDEWAERTGNYLPVISDGGLAGTGDMSVALAMGADALMMGRYFAGFAESPTEPYSKKFAVSDSGGSMMVSATVKPYWGEASARAKNVRRYQQNDPRTFVIEGEEGYVLMKGSIHDVLPRDLKAIKGTLSSCGCADLEEFRREVMLERQTVGSQAEGGTSIQLV